jgi:hypothetical protein
MKRKIKLFVLGVCLIGAAITTYSLTGTNSCATCTGSKPCNACKNCKYCKHCAKDGGTCGVCKK